MKIIVNDTNILIDLVDLDLLNYFTQLDYEMHTNDFIINEITDTNQKDKIDKLIIEGELIIAETDSIEYDMISQLMVKNLTFMDCSIWHYAIKVNGMLLTGDASLRKSAERSGIEVRGILFVFDKLIEENIIDPQTALEKLNKL